MLARARIEHPEVTFVEADATLFDLGTLGAQRPFDGCLSNAALHWMTDQASVLRNVRAVLRSGAPFVAEMGGAGNIAALDESLRAALDDLGLGEIPIPANHFPTVGQQSTLLEAAGFRVEHAMWFPRPTPLHPGTTAAGWTRQFRTAVWDAIPSTSHPALERAVTSTPSAWVCTSTMDGSRTTAASASTRSPLREPKSTPLASPLRRVPPQTPPPPQNWAWPGQPAARTVGITARGQERPLALRHGGGARALEADRGGERADGRPAAGRPPRGSDELGSLSRRIAHCGRDGAHPTTTTQAPALTPKQTATLSVTSSASGSGEVTLVATSNARSIQVKYRDADDTGRSATEKVREGQAQFTLPPGSSAIRARARATPRLTASPWVSVSSAPEPAPSPGATYWVSPSSRIQGKLARYKSVNKHTRAYYLIRSYMQKFEAAGGGTPGPGARPVR